MSFFISLWHTKHLYLCVNPDTMFLGVHIGTFVFVVMHVYLPPTRNCVGQQCLVARRPAQWKNLPDWCYISTMWADGWVYIARQEKRHGDASKPRRFSFSFPKGIRWLLGRISYHRAVEHSFGAHPFTSKYICRIDFGPRGWGWVDIFGNYPPFLLI